MPIVTLHGAAFGFDSESGAVVLKERATHALTVPDAANGSILATHDTDVMTHSLRFTSRDGTAYYLMATTTVTNRD